MSSPFDADQAPLRTGREQLRGRESSTAEDAICCAAADVCSVVAVTCSVEAEDSSTTTSACIRTAPPRSGPRRPRSRRPGPSPPRPTRRARRRVARPLDCLRVLVRAPCAVLEGRDGLVPLALHVLDERGDARRRGLRVLGGGKSWSLTAASSRWSRRWPHWRSEQRPGRAAPRPRRSLRCRPRRPLVSAGVSSRRSFAVPARTRRGRGRGCGATLAPEGPGHPATPAPCRPRRARALPGRASRRSPWRRA